MVDIGKYRVYFVILNGRFLLQKVIIFFIVNLCKPTNDIFYYMIVSIDFFLQIFEELLKFYLSFLLVGFQKFEFLLLTLIVLLSGKLNSESVFLCFLFFVVLSDLSISVDIKDLKLSQEITY